MGKFSSWILITLMTLTCFAPEALARGEKLFAGGALGLGKNFYSRESLGLSDSDFGSFALPLNFSLFIYHRLGERNHLGLDFTMIGESEIAHGYGRNLSSSAYETSTVSDGLISVTYWHYLSESLEDSATYTRIGFGPATRSVTRDGVDIQDGNWGYGGFLALGRVLGPPAHVNFFGELKYVGAMIRSVALQQFGFAIGIIF